MTCISALVCFKMDHSLSRDVIVMIACKIDFVDVVAVLSTCRACKEWDTPEFWKRLYSISDVQIEFSGNKIITLGVE